MERMELFLDRKDDLTKFVLCVYDGSDRIEKEVADVMGTLEKACNNGDGISGKLVPYLPKWQKVLRKFDGGTPPDRWRGGNKLGLFGCQVDTHFYEGQVTQEELGLITVTCAKYDNVSVFNSIPAKYLCAFESKEFVRDTAL
jgi:hypothetical protein